MNSRLFYFRKLLCATGFGVLVAIGDTSPIVNTSLQHPSPHGSESQADYDPFNGTGQNEPDIESENERGRRAYASILDPPCTERSRIVAESRER